MVKSMKKMHRHLVALVILAMPYATVEAAPLLQHSGRPSPDVSFEKVQEVFGFNLDTEDTLLKTLLLAVAMDHTSSTSPNSDQSIGIPFIVDRGPGYWVKRLNNGDRTIEVLANNAILLLFTKEKIPNGKSAAISLMRAAADKGYWPADYFIAEVDLEKTLSIDYTKPTPLTGKISGEAETIARSTMDKYNRCAEIGFAPCQFRIGFWLLGSSHTTKNGLDVLRHAINTTVNDSRYLGVLDNTVIMASNKIVQIGEGFGIDSLVRQEYGQLSKKYQAKVNYGTE